jgi:hypothetical protein
MESSADSSTNVHFPVACTSYATALETSLLLKQTHASGRPCLSRQSHHAFCGASARCTRHLTLLWITRFGCCICVQGWLALRSLGKHLLLTGFGAKQCCPLEMNLTPTCWGAMLCCNGRGFQKSTKVVGQKKLMIHPQYVLYLDNHTACEPQRISCP